ncbi:MAG: amidohydrolase [Clostridiales bacterium]|nr:amidohydrolase [Clostridiales bacterium]
MNIRLYNARIVPFASETAEVFEGEVWVQGDRISHVGVSAACDLTWDREIDCRGNLLLPGFKNAHAHSAMTFLRSLADDKPLLQWLREDVFPREERLTDDDAYWLTKLAILEYLTSGITAAFDMYFHLDAVAQSAINMGFRMVLCNAVNDFGTTVRAMQENYKKLNRLHPLISHQLAFHAEYTAGEKMLREIAAFAAEQRAPVFAHNSETREEVADCLARWSKTPTAVMDEMGLFAHGGGGFHCVHLTPEDIEIFQKRGLYAITNPGSNVKLASGIAPLAELAERGVPFALGTDGPASNNCLDFFREMFLATGLQKLVHGAEAMDANKVLRAACQTGARAMCLPACDSLQAGKQADLVMIDLHRPNMQPLNNLTKNVVYSGSKENVALTMVAGRILYENGVFFCGVDPEEIYHKANKITKRIIG